MTRYVFPFFSILVLSLVITAHPAHGQTAPNTNPPGRAQTQVARFGTGEKAKVTVRKNDGTKIKGYISRTNEASFDLTDTKTKQTSVISYSDVANIKKQGMSKGVKFAIIGGVVAAVAVVVVAVAAKDALDDACFLGCSQ